MPTKEERENTKNERFVRVAFDRMTKVMNEIDKLSKCADKRSYTYTQPDVERIFSSINGRLERAYSLFKDENGDGRPKKFSLSADWFFISADGGKTWTKQILMRDEVMEQIARGYMVVKTTPLAEPPRIKVFVVSDYKNNDIQIYASSTRIDATVIDTGSADPVDSDYEEHANQIQAAIDEIEARTKRNDADALFQII